MSKNMFAAFASDDEGDNTRKEAVKKPTTAKKNQPTKARPAKVAQGEDMTGDDFQAARGRGGARGRGDRGRAARGGRGRGRGERGRGDRARGYRGRGDGENRGRGRGGYPRRYYEDEAGAEGEVRGRGRGGRGRGQRGYRGGRYGGQHGDHKEGVYSHLATREQVLGEENKQDTEHHEDGENWGVEDKHFGYDKKSGTGHGREVKKGGHGKGGWGDDAEQDLEHKGAETAAEIAEDGHVDEAAVDAAAKPATEVEAEKEEEEEDHSDKMTLAEYKAKMAKDKQSLSKAEARKPEEIKLANIEKHNDGIKKKDKGSNIKGHESYAPTAIKAPFELGFGTAPEEPEEEYFDRPARGARGGRGRGDRGRGARGGRGGHNERGRGGPRRGRGSKFVAQDNDFPSL